MFGFLTSDINKKYFNIMNYEQLDAFMMRVLWWHFGVYVLVTILNAWLKLSSYIPSPLSWRIIPPLEALGGLALALCASLVPYCLLGKLRNHYFYRLLISFSLVVYSYLFVFISGGAIEMHFHFFIVLALLTIYSDWRLGWFVALLTALHHSLVNSLAPNWVYHYGKNDLSVVAHTIPVIVAVIFTTILCRSNRKSIIDLQNLRLNLERTVSYRTRDLQLKVVELERFQKLSIGRELRMAELKKELEQLRTTTQKTQ